MAAHSLQSPNRKIAKPLFSVSLIVLLPLFLFRGSPSLVTLSQQFGEIPGRTLSEARIWISMGLVLFIALSCEKHPWQSIGLRSPTWGTLKSSLIGICAIYVLAILAQIAVSSLPKPPDNLDSIAASIRWSLGFGLCTAVRAGVTEEVLYRGVLIEQLTRLTGRRWIAATLAGAIFVAAHSFMLNWLEMLNAAMATIALTGLYLIRRDLLANIFAHTLIDVISTFQIIKHSHVY